MGRLTRKSVRCRPATQWSPRASYTPKGVAKDGWHKLDVRIRNRKADVKARPGYMAGS